MRKIRAHCHLAVLGLACAVLAGGPLASAGVTPRPVDRPPVGPRLPPLRWRACHHGFECAIARVPLNYRHPRGKRIDIAVIMHRAPKATARPGTLFVNGGGPAEQILPFLSDFPGIPAVLRQRFDIITFDPRGFGFSTPLRCFSSEAAENRLLGPVLPFALFPVGARQTATFERIYTRFDARCARAAGPLLNHDATADVAKDMNLLRQAVGAPRLNYIGLSYGTGLGAVYANMFPSKVGHMVLDGNLNPVAWTSGGKLPAFIREPDDLAAAAELRSFLALCGQQPTSACAFSAGSPAATRAKFATLERRLMHHAVTADGQRVTYAGLFQVVPPENVVQWQPAAAELQRIWVASEHSGPARPSLAARAAPPFGGPSVAAAATPSTAAAAPYTGLEQGFGVLCADTDDPPSFADYLTAARLARARSGPFGLLDVWTEAICADWPRTAGQDRYAGPWNRRTASPILVIGNTDDPTTAYQNSVAMARDLNRARLLTVDGFGHTEFFNPSACASSYELRYLITGRLPPTGTVCQQTVMPFPSRDS
jgi:pimeloyl-ACP methyl ester carboxylesterase